MRLAGTPSHPSYPLHRNAGSTSVPNRRSDSIASACVMLPKFMLSRSSLDADVLESGSGGDGSTVRQLSGKWVPLRVRN